MVEDDPLLNANQAADICHVAPQTMAAWRCAGRGPRYVKIGRAVFYRQSAIAAWLKSQERDPAAKSAARAA